jgi:5-formyltetrahydrofolate cyclo-ligase
VCLPCIENQLIFRAINSLNFPYKTIFKIPQPTNGKIINPCNLKLLIVPCVGYYRKYRLGYGKNYYRDFLFNKKIPSIIVGYKMQKIKFNYQKNQNYFFKKIVD